MGGAYTTAGGVTVNNIAKWNGTAWSSLGTGITGPMFLTFVLALTVYNGELIAGGEFTTAGGITVNSIAKWNGTVWAPLGSGIGGIVQSVRALTVYNGELIAAGEFTTAGGDTVNNIAKWNGTNWSPLGSGMDSYVISLTVYNNELIAGGTFTTAGGASASRIAKWNGINWSPLGSGTNNNVIGLTVYNNELIASGSFTTAGGIGANRIAKWNGTNWLPLGTGMNNSVNALTVYNNVELIAGGRFTTAGVDSAKYITKWNGTEWASLGSGMAGGGLSSTSVNSLTVYSDDIIACGNFTTAGGVSANYIAKWGLPTGIKSVNQNMPERFGLEQNYPNPFNSVTSIKFQVTSIGVRSQETEVRLTVFDLLGREVATLVNEELQAGTYTVEWDARDIPSGIYFYRMQAGNYVETRKLVLNK